MKIWYNTYSTLGAVKHIGFGVSLRCNLVGHEVGVRHSGQLALPGSMEALPEGQEVGGGNGQHDQAVVLGDSESERHCE